MNRIRYPNGVEFNLSRDDRGRMTGIEFSQDGLVFEGQDRILDPVGNPTTRTRPGFLPESFQFDTLDRLLEVAHGGSVAETYL